MSITIRLKDKSMIKEIMSEILEKYKNSIEILQIESSEFYSKELVQRLLSLPDHHRKTFETLIRLEEASAQQVASITKRARAVESAYLNHLVHMNFLEKRRKGRKVYFYLPEEYKSLKL